MSRSFFNALLKSDSTFFKLQKPPRYLTYVDLQKNMLKTTKIMDFWMCADGREVLLKDILQGNVSLINQISQKSKNGDCDVDDSDVGDSDVGDINYII